MDLSLSSTDFSPLSSPATPLAQRRYPSQCYFRFSIAVRSYSCLPSEANNTALAGLPHQHAIT